MNTLQLLRTFLVGLKRVLLRVVRTGGIGFKLLGLPTKRISVSETEAFFRKRADSAYFFRSYNKNVITLKPAVNSLGLEPLDNQYSFEHFIMSLPKGSYCHRHPSVITSDGLQLAMASNHPELSQNEHVLFQQLFLPRPVKFKGCGLVLTTANDNNYYHCLFQIPPKIWLLEQHGVDLNHIDWYLLENSTASFQDEIISSLGIDKNKIRNLKQHPHVRGEHLMVLPSFWKPEPWICKRLRNTFLDKHPLSPRDSKRIYISRNKASYRRILNENDLLEVLNRYGFKVLQLEGLSIKEQACIFQSAEMVMSAHGAALANTVFCDPGTPVIEFRHPVHYTDLGRVYEHLSSICQLQHFTFLCQGEANTSGDSAKFFDLKVEVENVEKLLNDMFENKSIAL